MPDIIIVAGPNGAGKTSFANQYRPRLRKRCLAKHGGGIPARNFLGHAMTKVIDRRKMEQALRQAAKDAVSGPRDVRAGRFAGKTGVRKSDPDRKRDGAGRSKSSH